MEEGGLIVYTSADSVFQIAAHEDIVPVEKLYEYCEIARNMLQGDLAVGRVIARPFVGEDGDFIRTSRRHDFSLEPTGPVMMDFLKDEGYETIGVGKINDIFAGRSISETHPTKNNDDGMDKTLSIMDKDFKGLCFVNLVDFDMVYGHRNDVDGYAKAMSDFDKNLGKMMEKLDDKDIVILTADHGCDPETPSTDHSREYVPMIIFGKDIKEGINLNTRQTFADIRKTITDIFDVKSDIKGESFYESVKK